MRLAILLSLVLAVAVCTCGEKMLLVKDSKGNVRQIPENTYLDKNDNVRPNPQAKAPFRLPSILYVIAGVAVIVGIIASVVLRQIPLGIPLGISTSLGGALLMGCMYVFERFPWLILIPIGLAAIAGGLFLWQWYRGIRSTEALQVVVPAVQAAEPVPGPLKAAIAANAGSRLDAVKATIRRVKKQVGIPIKKEA